MADSAVSTQSRPRRDASTKKRREATVSTETEKKLARAARSAQRLAQLSDVSRDDSTLDLFPDDPTRATLEAMNIDVRQGTLHGFELPDVVLAAVGALDTPSDGTSADAKAARRAPRAARADEPARIDAQLSGLEIEPSTVAGPDAAHPVPAAGLNDQMNDQNDAVVSPREAIPPLSPAMAAATVARSVTALRQAAEREVETVGSAVGNRLEAGGKSSQRSASGRKMGAAVADQADLAEGSAASARGEVSAPASARNANESAVADRSTRETPATASSADVGSAFAAPWQEAQRAEAAATAAAVQRAAPELDRARATAFADTVDALYGVISDQRRAATDHSRRMKWMLSIVVGALLMTVAIGITQTMLLMRLTRETTVQQHRIEQMLQSQQTAMASVLDTQMAMANAAHAAPPTLRPAPAPQQALMAPESANGQRAMHARHIRKPKTANSH
ncbi:hypothetical protein [Paraburkholderia caledonica]|uniref:hypothetical protein n=1 Tax=Paraburkholderia caledonica TaxID=134536 RepID=UPI000B49481E|nr:hypothetical protein BWU74_29625 [Burkholderia sp. Bk]